MPIQMSTVAFEAITRLPYEEAVARCRAELSREGFGVLTEIDLKSKLGEKLGVEIPPNIILGACHPASAYKAITAVPEVTVLLPCNVAVAVEARGTVVRAMNPAGAMEMLANPVLDEVAADIGARLRRVVETLQAA